MRDIKDFFDSGDTFKSLRVLFSGMLATAAIGSVYMWSVFVIPLGNHFGWARDEISFVFSLSMVFFSMGVIFCAYLLARFTIAKVMTMGALLLSGSYFCTSFCDNIYAMYLIYGFLGGTGMGLILNTTLYACNLWFLKNFGVISGILQACLGLSALFLGALTAGLIDAYGWQVALRIFSLITAVMTLPAVLFVRARPPELVSGGKPGPGERQRGGEAIDITWQKMLKTSAFCRFWLMRVAVLTGGLSFISIAVPLAIELGQSPSAAVFAMGMMSFCNALGRIMLGIIWDHSGPERTMFLNNGMFIVASALLILVTFSHWHVIVFPAFALAGLAYGGMSLIGVAFTRSFFGTKYFAANYGVATTATMAASFIGPYITSWIKITYGTYNQAFYIFIGLGFFAMLCGFGVKQPAAGRPGAV